MQPNYTNNYAKERSLLRAGILFLILVVLLLCGLLFYKNMQFHLIKTDPKLSAVSQYTSEITLYYNRALDVKSVNVYDPGAILSGKTIEDKTVTVKFGQKLQTGTTYAFIVRGIKSSDGTVLPDRKIEFTVKNIPLNKLSESQQKKIIANQDKYPYAVENIRYSGFDSLIDQGVTSGEMLDIQTDIFKYSKVVNQQFWDVALDPSSLVIAFHDPSAREANASSATFDVKLSGNLVKIRSEYDGISDVTYTRIFDTAGNTLYDSSVQSN